MLENQGGRGFNTEQKNSDFLSIMQGVLNDDQNMGLQEAIKFDENFNDLISLSLDSTNPELAIAGGKKKDVRHNKKFQEFILSEDDISPGNSQRLKRIQTQGIENDLKFNF